MPKGSRSSTAADNIQLRKTRVHIEKEHVASVSSSDFPGTYPDVDDAFDLEQFKKSFKVDIRKLTDLDMVFDLVGIDASIANAFRRILIAEVPTLAFEKVFILNNTSIVADEVLSHRLGLIPIQCDPAQFQYRKDAEEPPTDLNTIVFKLHVKCTRKLDAAVDEVDPDKLYNHHLVTSGDLVWMPQGDQEARFKDCPIRPVHDDIVIAKLRPGMEIDLQLHGQKGVGKDHAKFSPVSTASYRLLPEIRLLKEVRGELAEKLCACFPEGVLGIQDGKAVVLDARKDTVSREVLRHPEFEGMVQLLRVRDHFIFSIESTGIVHPEDLFRQAVEILIEKCRMVKSNIATKLS